jgi:hypothetical protein
MNKVPVDVIAPNGAKYRRNLLPFSIHGEDTVLKVKG